MADEREMSIHQCGLVDTCFEEGQLGPAIAVLDQLRSPRFRPRPDHLRQLLYVALVPPSGPGHTPDSGHAQRVLFSFLATNAPASLARALPAYDLPPGPIADHDGDSPVARESLCIKHARSCWLILRQGFIHPLDPDPPAVVAEHAWPILDWLLSLFEKDERLASQNSPEKFSLLLLSQIPPPRGGIGPRWDAGAPLDIIFLSLEQDDSLRRPMAARLLVLLINLSLSGSFDATMFAAALATRLYTSSPQTVQNLFETLPRTIPVLSFNVTVCQKFLSSSPSTTAGAKPRPRPLPRREPRGAPSSAADNDASRSGSLVIPPPTLATCSDVFQLLRTDHESASAPVSTIKYILLVSYAHLQRLLPPGERDGDWKSALSNGGLRNVIDSVFPSDNSYHTALTILTTYWPPSD